MTVHAHNTRALPGGRSSGCLSGLWKLAQHPMWKSCSTGGSGCLSSINGRSWHKTPLVAWLSSLCPGLLVKPHLFPRSWHKIQPQRQGLSSLNEARQQHVSPSETKSYSNRLNSKKNCVRLLLYIYIYIYIYMCIYIYIYVYIYIYTYPMLMAIALWWERSAWFERQSYA